MSEPTLSVVVISYNRPSLLAQCLTAVYAQAIEDRIEVIVVDNLSPTSPEVAKVVADYPEVRFLPQASNLGFAAGANVGIAAARGDYIHLHEDDIILQPGFYRTMLSVAQSQPNALLSGLIFEEPGKHLLFAGIELEIGSRYIQSSYSAVISPEPYPTGMLLGAMMFGRKEIFQRVGRFRPEFFVYFEDAEYCWRARLRGVRLLVVPAAQGVHLRPADSRQSPFIEYHKLKNYIAINLLYMRPLPLAWLVLKYFSYTSVRKAFQLRSFLFLMRIWFRAIYSLPIYILERITRLSPTCISQPGERQCP